MSSKFNNIQNLIKILHGHQQGVTLEQLKNSLKVDARTVKRYLTELRESGHQILDTREAANHPSKYLMVKDDQPPAHLVPTLKKIKNELNSWGNPKFAESINQVIKYLVDVSSPTLQNLGESENLPASSSLYNIDHGPFSQQEIAPGVLGIIENAIKNSLQLRLRYTGYKNAPSDMIFFPYRLSLRVGTLYLIGRVAQNKGIYKSLSLKRITRCVSTGEQFKPAKFDVKNYYKYCFGQFPRQEYEKPVLLVLQVKEKWLERFLSESHFNPPGKIVKEGSKVFFHLQVIIKPDLVNWILSLYPYMLTVKPESLVNTVKNRLKNTSG